MKLHSASTIVKEELDRLEHLSDAAFNSVNRLFEELGEILEKKRLEIMSDVRRRKEEKKMVLQQQLKEIEAESNDLSGQSLSTKQMELLQLPSRIQDLNSKLDCLRF